MNHTPNYQLSQWAKSDQVKMEDFNADNAKLDAAIKAVDAKADAVSAAKADKTALEAVRALALRSRYIKLKEYTCAQGLTSLYIYLNDIDWTQWDKLYLDVKLNAGGSIFFFDNDTASEHIGYMNCDRAGDGSWSKRVVFNVGYRADRALDVTCGASQVSVSTTYAQLVKVAFFGSSVVSKGAQYVLWGEK